MDVANNTQSAPGREGRERGDHGTFRVAGGGGEGEGEMALRGNALTVPGDHGRLPFRCQVPAVGK
jgi:hypothetical protein